jgi:hypothetical protein
MEDTDLHQAQVKMSNKYRDNPLTKKDIDDFFDLKIYLIIIQIIMFD